MVWKSHASHDVQLRLRGGADDVFTADDAAVDDDANTDDDNARTNDDIARGGDGFLLPEPARREGDDAF